MGPEQDCLCCSIQIPTDKPGDAVFASAVFIVLRATFLLIFSPDVCWSVPVVTGLHGECQMRCSPS